MGRRIRFGGSTGASGFLGDMWWGGTSQNGWGLAVLEQTPKIFPILYTYDESGAPTWYVVPSGTWTGNVFKGPLVSTTGSPWVGQAYDPSRLRATEAGSFSLEIGGRASGTMSIGIGTRSLFQGIVREFD